MRRAPPSTRLLVLASLALAPACAPETQETDAAEPDGPIGEARAAMTVAEAASSSCSTLSVKGLSEQIIAQGNCIAPGAYALVPAQPNLSLGGPVFPFLEEPAKNALVAALQEKSGTTMQVNSMLRTVAQQYLLWRWGKNGQCGIGLAATPGNSNHETGLALDISGYSTWRATLEKHGFKWFGSNDAVHFDYAGPGAVSYKGVDVKAFQQLWNINHPEDKIPDDGAWNSTTEAKMKVSPAEGFPKGADCAAAGGKPDVHLAIRVPTASDDWKDGGSEGIADVFEGDAHKAELEVSNKGPGKAEKVSIRVFLEEPFLSADEYLIESDWGGQGFKENDSNALPENPPHGSMLPGSFTLQLNALSPGETKRVTLDLRAESYSIGLADAPDVRFWVEDIPNAYHQDEFGGDVNNVEGAQKYNGGRLEAFAQHDVYSRVRWEWNTPRLEGWTPEGLEATFDEASKRLVLAGSGEAARFVGPGTSFDASEGDVVLTGRRKAGSGPVRLYFTTEDVPEFSEQNSLEFELPEGTQAEAVTIPVTDHPAWRGKVLRLRLDPFGAGEGAIELDGLRVGEGKSPGESSTGASGGGLGEGGSGNPGLGPGEDRTGALSGSVGCACRQASAPFRSSALGPFGALLGLALARRARRRVC